MRNERTRTHDSSASVTMTKAYRTLFRDGYWFCILFTDGDTTSNDDCKKQLKTVIYF